MHDQPFSIFVFPDDGPAEISHFHFSALGSHLFFDGGRGPDEIPVWVHVSIIIDRKLRGLVTGENSFWGLLVFLPASILQGSNIEKSVRTPSVILLNRGRIERGPAVPDFLHEGFVGSGAGRCLLHRRVLGLSKTVHSQGEQSQRNGEKAS